MCTGAASHISLHLHLLSCRICHAGNIYCAHSVLRVMCRMMAWARASASSWPLTPQGCREVESKNIMAANKSGGDTRDSLRKANPPAVKQVLLNSALATVSKWSANMIGSPEKCAAVPESAACNSCPEATDSRATSRRLLIRYITLLSFWHWLH